LMGVRLMGGRLMGGRLMSGRVSRAGKLCALRGWKWVSETERVCIEGKDGVCTPKRGNGH
jgi:hypothetical protein